MSVATLAHLLLISGTTPPFFAVVPWLPAFTTPEASFFRFHDPAKNAPQLPALRAKVALVGRLRPHQFLLPRFRRTENRPKTSLNLPGRYPYPPALPRGHTAAHKGKHGAISVSVESAPAPLETAGRTHAGSCRFAAGSSPPSCVPTPPAQRR